VIGKRAKDGAVKTSADTTDKGQALTDVGFEVPSFGFTAIDLRC